MNHSILSKTTLFMNCTEYEIEDMVLEYSEAYPEKYYEYLSTGGY